MMSMGVRSQRLVAGPVNTSQLLHEDLRCCETIERSSQHHKRWGQNYSQKPKDTFQRTSWTVKSGLYIVQWLNTCKKLLPVSYSTPCCWSKIRTKHVARL